MGCVSSLGPGLAMVQSGRRVVMIDGDGAMLMRLGQTATNGHYRLPNLVHVLLDNSAHDSTGGQATVSDTADLGRVAWACGYPRIVRVGAFDELNAVLQQNENGPTFIHVKTKVRSDRRLPRPEMSPIEMTERFRRWIRDTS